MRKEDNSYQQQPQQNYYPPQPSNYTIWVPNNPNIDAYQRARQNATFGGYGQPNPYQPNPYNRGGYGYQQNPYGGNPYGGNPYGMPPQQPQQPYGMPPQQPYGEQPKDKKKAKKPKVPKVYKARKPILFILALLMIAVIVVNVLPVFGVVGKFTAPFIGRDAAAGDGWEEQVEYLSFADPIISLVKSFTSKGATEEEEALADEETEEAGTSMFTNRFYTDCLSKMDEYKPNAEEGVDGDITKMIAFYAFPIVVILFIILSVYLAIKLLVAAIKGKKMKFGYSYLIGIIYLVAMAFIVVMWNGLGMSEIGTVFLSPINILSATEEAAPTIASKAAIGLGFYITAVIYVLSLILNFFSYKRDKKAEAQSQQQQQYYGGY